MTEQEKQLLLKDLCSRLPYGVKIHCKWHMFQEEKESEDIGTLLAIDYRKDRVLVKRKNLTTYFYVNSCGCNIKPYLRPMSDLTFEEFKKIHLDGDILYNADDKIVISESWETVDYMNEIMIDYRGLIWKGLALKALEGMYK